MTTLELIAFLEYLDSCGLLSIPMEQKDYEKVIWNYQKKTVKPEWTDRFFPPTTENK
jgi:hypothetical protein